MANDSGTQKENGYTRVEIFKAADDHGRVGHFRFWMTDYKPGHPDGEYKLREVGQVFFAPLPEGIFTTPPSSQGPLVSDAGRNGVA